MKRLVVIFLLALVAGQRSMAESMDSLFASMPPGLLPFVNRDNRLDCLDLYNNKMRAEVQNELGEKTRLVEKTDDYLRLEISKVSRMELKLLRQDGDTLVGMIHTVMAPNADSRVRFYTTAWQPVTDVKLPKPDSDAFWHKPDSVSVDRFQHWKSAVDTSWVAASFSAGSPELTYTLSIESVRSDWRDRIAACLQKQVYSWDGKEFQKVAP